MADIIFKPFDQQQRFLNSNKRIKGAFAGKRGGKTEVGAIQGILFQENKPDFTSNGIDPYLGVITAPTYDMLKRLSWKKFNAYAKPFIKHQTKAPLEIEWYDHDPDKNYESLIYGISADNPSRLEGVKANWIWLDEVFQMSEQFFLECIARVSDQNGFIFCTGSLGVQFVNPKQHWAFKYFKESPDQDTECIEWSTEQNPYFPNEQIDKLRDKLDPETFRQMFTISWDSIPKNAVYSNFSDINVTKLGYRPELPTVVAIDWGWAHKMAVGFFQIDKARDHVYLIDEIVGSQILLEQLYEKIMIKPYNISKWVCDIAGNQEREQTGISNIRWFRDKHIGFSYRKTAINYGIPVVRSYIKNAKGQARFFINETCKHSIDGMRRYRYAEKDGIILNENPVKENDDCVDMIRYFFVNCMDSALNVGPQVLMYDR